MRRAFAVGLGLLLSCANFEQAEQEFCRNNPRCRTGPDGGTPPAPPQAIWLSSGGGFGPGGGLSVGGNDVVDPFRADGGGSFTPGFLFTTSF